MENTLQVFHRGREMGSNRTTGSAAEVSTREGFPQLPDSLLALRGSQVEGVEE